MTPLLRRATSLLPTTSLWLIATVVQAQSATDPIPLAPVTVTARPPDPLLQAPGLATGMSGTLLDTPFSLTQVPAERVREQGGTTLQDALRNVPGAQADSGFQGAHTQFFILRGAVSDSGTGANRVLRDGVRLSSYPYVPAFVESVDVLRGPGAATAVRSEPGGTVNLVTRQPHLVESGSLHVRMGSAHARELSVDLNHVLSRAHGTAARLIATRSEASDWRHVPDRLDGVKVGLAHAEGRRYHLHAGFEATNQVYRPDYGLPSLGSRPVDVPADRQLGEPFADSTTRNRLVDLHGDVAVGPHTRLAVGLTHLEATSTSVRNVLSGDPIAGQAPGTWARVSSWEPASRRKVDAATVSSTSQLSLGGVAHELHVGLVHFTETLNQPGIAVPASSSPPINVFEPVYGGVTAPPPGSGVPSSLTRQDLEATGWSVQDKAESGPWTLVAGLRLDRQKFVYGSAAVRSVAESRWSPKVAVLRKLSERHSVHANVTTGMSPNQVASSTDQSLPSRRAAQVEVGWKALWRDGSLVSDVAIYQLDQTNMISPDTSTPAQPFDFTVDGSARSRGLEASLTGAVTRRADVAVTYAYTAAGYGEHAAHGGRQVPNVARHAATLWGRYRWSEAAATGAGLHVQSRRFADEANTVVLPGYARADVMQQWHLHPDGLPAVELQLAVRNVLDKRYHVSSHLHVSRWVTPAQGRHLALSATTRF